MIKLNAQLRSLESAQEKIEKRISDLKAKIGELNDEYADIEFDDDFDEKAKKKEFAKIERRIDKLQTEIEDLSVEDNDIYYAIDYICVYCD